MTGTVLLIIPGAHCPSLVYYDFRDSLKRLSPALRDVVVYDLPSASCGPPLPPPTLSEDGAYFAERIKELAVDGTNVVILAHSYGGFVAREAIRGLSKEERSQHGERGGVTGIIYLTAVISEGGRTLRDTCADVNFNFVLPYEEGSEDYLRLDVADTAAAFFSDLPPREGIRWAVCLTLQSVAPLRSPSTELSQMDHAIPSTYILCTRDQCLSVSFRRRMVESLKRVSKPGTVQVIEMATDHCPNASEPENLAKLVNSILFA